MSVSFVLEANCNSWDLWNNPDTPGSSEARSVVCGLCTQSRGHNLSMVDMCSTVNTKPTCAGRRSVF